MPRPAPARKPMLGWPDMMPAMTPTMIAPAIMAPPPRDLLLPPFMGRSMASAIVLRQPRNSCWQKLVNAAFTTVMRQIESG